MLMALFACLIIRTFQLIFSAGTVFFSHNKSAGTVFRLIFFSEANEALVFGRSELWFYAKRGQGWRGYDRSIVFEIRSFMLGV